MSSQRIQTKYGSFYVEATPQGLSKFEFPSSRHSRMILAGTSKIGSPTKAFGDDMKKLKKVAHLVENYLEGKPVEFSGLKFDLTSFTPAEQKVLKTLVKVRRGNVVTYQQLAEKAGFPRAARFVGSVMRKNRLPLIIPCHRVVTSNGKLGGYSCGLPWKKRLLKLEGVKYNFAS